MSLDEIIYDKACSPLSGVIIVGFLVLRLIAPLLAHRIPEIQLVQGTDSATLVVVLHGLVVNHGLG
ncbi:MAG: hypothetical protein R3B74_11175 [Nitrospirales bacterium]|nr:hypothetical protein [Nitrospirales bacterium]